jgi:hypothetical protein
LRSCIESTTRISPTVVPEICTGSGGGGQRVEAGGGSWAGCGVHHLQKRLAQWKLVPCPGL